MIVSEAIGEEAALAYFKYTPAFTCRGKRRYSKSSIRLFGVLARIRKGYFGNISQNLHRLFADHSGGAV
jgi:hypothetical protein